MGQYSYWFIFVVGYGCTIVTPDKNSDEKMSTITLLGAEVVQTPAMALYGDPKNFASVAAKLLEEDPNAISLDQVKVSLVAKQNRTSLFILKNIGSYLKTLPSHPNKLIPFVILIVTIVYVRQMCV